MPTEDDLRVAFRDMERLTPDAADVLRAVYDHPRRSARSRRLPPLVPRRPALRAALALGAAGAVAAGAVIAAVAQGPATKATSIAAPALRTRLLAAIETASGDILYTPAPGAPLAGGQYPAYPQPGQEVHVRVGPAVGSDGKVYKDGEYSFTMPSETALPPSTTTPPTSTRAGCSFPERSWRSTTSTTPGVRAIRRSSSGSPSTRPVSVPRSLTASSRSSGRPN